MTGEEEIVRRCDGHGVAHEGCGVNDESAGHRAGDSVKGESLLVEKMVREQGEEGGRTILVIFEYPLLLRLGYRSSRPDPRNLPMTI